MIHQPLYTTPNSLLWGSLQYLSHVCFNNNNPMIWCQVSICQKVWIIFELAFRHLELGRRRYHFMMDFQQRSPCIPQRSRTNLKFKGQRKRSGSFHSWPRPIRDEHEDGKMQCLIRRNRMRCEIEIKASTRNSSALVNGGTTELDQGKNVCKRRRNISSRKNWDLWLMEHNASSFHVPQQTWTPERIGNGLPSSCAPSQEMNKKIISRTVLFLMFFG